MKIYFGNIKSLIISILRHVVVDIKDIKKMYLLVAYNSEVGIVFYKT